MDGLIPGCFKDTKVEWYDFAELPKEIKCVYAPCVDTIYVNRLYPEIKDRKPEEFFQKNIMYVHTDP